MKQRIVLAKNGLDLAKIDETYPLLVYIPASHLWQWWQKLLFGRSWNEQDKAMD